MLVIYPKNWKKLVVTHLRSKSIPDKRLRFTPEIVRDSEVVELIRPFLLSKAWHIRKIAAEIMCSAGFKEGIRHITYCSIRRHPLAGEYNIPPPDHVGRSIDWYDLTENYAAYLDEDCVELLINDMEGKWPLFHGFTLALYPGILPLDRLKRMLEYNHESGLLAAVTLAFLGDESGRDVLENAIKKQSNLLLAFYGLSCIPNHRTENLIKPYKDLNHDFYQKKEGFKNVLKAAHIICNYLDRKQNPLWDTVMRFGSDNVSDLRVFNHDSKSLPPGRILCHGALCHEVAIWGRCRKDERGRLFRYQKEQVEKLIDKLSIDYRILWDHRIFSHMIFRLPYGGKNGSGIRIEFDKDDYVDNASNWLRDSSDWGVREWQHAEYTVPVIYRNSPNPNEYMRFINQRLIRRLDIAQKLEINADCV